MVVKKTPQKNIEADVDNFFTLKTETLNFLLIVEKFFAAVLEKVNKSLSVSNNIDVNYSMPELEKTKVNGVKEFFYYQEKLDALCDLLLNNKNSNMIGFMMDELNNSSNEFIFFQNLRNIIRIFDKEVNGLDENLFCLNWKVENCENGFSILPFDTMRLSLMPEEYSEDDYFNELKKKTVYHRKFSTVELQFRDEILEKYFSDPKQARNIIYSILSDFYEAQHQKWNEEQRLLNLEERYSVCESRM